ncbi:MAG: hypothetical protein JWQ18_657 [Conexibacter sp.]|nr:hypothetical protein [Conexibacter sp.]
MQPSPHTYQYPKVTPLSQSGAPKPAAAPSGAVPQPPRH